MKRKKNENYFIIGFYILNIFFLMLWSWGKWYDSYIDFGTQLQIPLDILNGKTLYKDINYICGPISQYFNALLYQLFTPSIKILVFANLTILIATTFLIFKIFTKMSNKYNAILISLFFLNVFAFSQYLDIGNYNFISPYRHEATHSTFLTILIILLIQKYLENKYKIILINIGFLLGCIFLMKSEFFLPPLMVCMVFILIRMKSSLQLYVCVKEFSLIFVSSLIPVTAFLYYIYSKSDFNTAINGIFGNWLEIFSKPTLNNIFIQKVMGFDNIKGNLILIVKCSLIFILFIALISFQDYLYYKLKNKKRTLYSISLIIINFYIFIYLQKHYDLFLTTRFFPVVSFLIFIVYFHITFSKTKSNTTSEYILLWVTFSSTLLLKTILNCRIDHLGFIHSMPITLLIITLLYSIIPDYYEKHYSRGKIFKIIILVFIFSIIVFLLKVSNKIYTLKNYKIEIRNDIMYDLNPKVRPNGIIISHAINKLKTVTSKKSTLLVIPEGAIINYALNLNNPTPYYQFSPIHIARYGGSKKITNILEKNKPDFIIKFDKINVEYKKHFGEDKDSGSLIMNWIKRNYTLISFYKPFLKNCYDLTGYKLYKKLLK